MHDIAEKLEKVGLSKKEALVYAFLLTVPGAYPSGIAEKTKLNRSTTYKILVALSVKGLVGEIEKGKKIYYRSESPKKLRYLIKHQLETAELASEYSEKLTPVLEGIFNSASGRPGVVYYEGKDAVVQAYLSHIHVERGYEMLAFVSTVDLKKFLPSKVFRHYIKEKERLAITARGISSDRNTTTTFNKELFSGIKKSIWPRFRHVQGQLFNFPGEITLFDSNKISIIKFDLLHPMGVIIEDQMVYDMMKAIFEIVWNTAKE